MFSISREITPKVALRWTGGWLLAALLTVGCANPGPPRPPSLDLPAPVRDLVVQRVGDGVEAAWTTPRLTTDKTTVPGAISAVLCLEENAAILAGKPATGAGTPVPVSASLSPCVEVARQVVIPGATGLTVTLTPNLSVGLPRPLIYRVELRNAHGRSAGKSNAAWTVAGAAPAAAGPIQVTARPEGVLVTWKPAAPGAENGTMELLRRTLTAAPASDRRQQTGRKSVHNAASSSAGTAHSQTTRSRAVGAAEEIRLTASEDATSGQPGVLRDPGGVLDRSVESGATYSYVAQRVRTVNVAGHALRIVGAASAPATLTYRDVFPPTAPQGLEAVPEGGFASVAGQTPVLSIDLSWEPSAEGNVSGYNVYRSGSEGQFVRLNSLPVTTPAYRDATVRAGTGYRYRVTVVDIHGNESAPSAEVEEQLQP